MRRSLLFPLLLVSSLAFSGGHPNFTFKPGQSVYVVALSAKSSDMSLSYPSLRLERKAREQFVKLGVFRTVSSLADADFVFVVLRRARPSSPARGLPVEHPKFRALPERFGGQRACPAIPSRGPCAFPRVHFVRRSNSPGAINA